MDVKSQYLGMWTDFIWLAQKYGLVADSCELTSYGSLRNMVCWQILVNMWINVTAGKLENYWLS